MLGLKHLNSLRDRLLQLSWIVDDVDAFFLAETQHHANDLWGTFLVNRLHLLEQQITDVLILSILITNLLNLLQCQTLSLGWLHDLRCRHLLAEVGGLLSSGLVIHFWECLLREHLLLLLFFSLIILLQVYLNCNEREIIINLAHLPFSWNTNWVGFLEETLGKVCRVVDFVDWDLIGS